MFINLTGHEIHELNSGLLLPAGPELRLHMSSTRTMIDNVRVHRSIARTTTSELPPRVDGVIYIVSALALNAIPADRQDFVCPKSIVRNEQGTVIGCRDFRTL